MQGEVSQALQYESERPSLGVTAILQSYDMSEDHLEQMSVLHADHVVHDLQKVPQQSWYIKCEHFLKEQKGLSSHSACSFTMPTVEQICYQLEYEIDIRGVI